MKHTQNKWMYEASNKCVVSDGNIILMTCDPWYPSQVLQDGESWLSMRKRIKPDQLKVDKERIANGFLASKSPELLKSLIDVVKFLNCCPHLTEGQKPKGLNNWIQLIDDIK